MSRLVAAILDWSLHHRGAVIAIWLGIAGAGVLAALRLPLDAFPDTTPVLVQVNTVAPALSPVEIERRITAPVELALGGLPALVDVRSVSKFGFSQVTLVFEDGADLMVSRQLVGERLAGVALEPGLGPPTLGPPASGLGEVFQYVVHGERSLAELRTLQDLHIRPRLRNVPGVAEINTWGGDEPRVEIRVDPERLRRFGIDLPSFAEAVRDNLGNVPGGPLDVGGEGVLVQGVMLPTTREALAGLVVASAEGVPLTLGQLATIEEGRAIRRGVVTAAGRGEVVLGLGFARLGEDGRAVSQRLELALQEIRRSLPRGASVTTLDVRPVYERTWLVDQVLATAGRSLAEGAALVIAVLLLFLGSLRAGLVVALVIPLSMLVAGNLMLAFGVAGSLMSLGAIDFGVLVDSAVIQVENVVARGPVPEDQRLAVVRDAVLEVRGPTLYGELVIACVFLPVLTLEGIEGRLFQPMALTMLFALLGSLLLSLTLVPALASLVTARRPHRPAPWRRPFALLVRAYRGLLRAGLRRPVVVLGTALMALGGAGYVAAGLGAEFVPRLLEGSIVLNTVRLAGVSLDTSAGYGTRIERMLLEAFPTAIEHIWTRTGSAEVTTDPMGLEVSDVFITLRARDAWQHDGPGGYPSQDALVAAMTERMRALPGMRSAFTQPIEMRINEMVAGIRADVGVILHGDDYAVLVERAQAIAAVLRAIPGAADVSAEQVTGQPVLQVVVDPLALGRRPIEVRHAMAVVAALGGIDVGVMPRGEQRLPIAVVLDERYRHSVAELGKVLVTAPGGERVRLDQIARLERVEAPASIQREDGRRRVVVECNVRGRDLGGFVAEARAALATRVPLPDGYYLRFGGQYEHLERASERLLIVIPLAVGLVLVLLTLAYRSARDVLRVFVGIPFAAVGGVVALALRGMPFSVSAGIGFVALAGVSVLADMVLVSSIRKRLDAGEPIASAVVDAAAQRLRPVLMTALVASLGFVPMMLAQGFGAEVQRPLATVVVGGVVSSTLLTLLVLPVLYRVTSRRASR